MDSQSKTITGMLPVKLCQEENSTYAMESNHEMVAYTELEQQKKVLLARLTGRLKEHRHKINRLS